MTIVLYDYWRSSSAYRLRIALNLLGLRYQSRSVNLLKDEQSEPAHLARNPQGLVPVLEIDGQRMTQSLAIIEYLSERHAAGLLPEDAEQRHRARALAYVIAMDIQPVCNLKVVKYAVAAGGSTTTQSWMHHFITEGFSAFEAMLGDAFVGPFALGRHPTIVDICLVPQAYNAQRWGVELSAYPRLASIVIAMATLPEVAAAHPDLVKPID
ncbi:MAG TPA: maleylacetoacetate isomerase [Devosia sp.]|nr:maleylacetoacetate isomerase [Devosia sp.]